MDSDPPKPKSAIPLHLTNGTSPLHVTQETRDSKERENLYAAINASSTARRPIDLGHPPDISKIQNPKAKQRRVPIGNLVEEEHARDPRDEASPPTPLTTSRPQSPIIQQPPIDFDGLSWPSKLPL